MAGGRTGGAGKLRPSAGSPGATGENESDVEVNLAGACRGHRARSARYF